MISFKKHMPFFILAMLILIMVPMSFAADVNNNATNEIGVSEDISTDVISYSDEISNDDNEVISTEDDSVLSEGESMFLLLLLLV